MSTASDSLPKQCLIALLFLFPFLFLLLPQSTSLRNFAGGGGGGEEAGGDGNLSRRVCDFCTAELPFCDVSSAGSTFDQDLQGELGKKKRTTENQNQNQNQKATKKKKKKKLPSSSSSISSQVTATTTAHYSALPYPHRDPSVELTTFVFSLIPLYYFDATLFRRRAFTLPTSQPSSHPLRILVAGGGTGDFTVYTAELCAQAVEEARGFECGGAAGYEITHLDLSKPSMEVARKRLEARKLLNGGRAARSRKGSVTLIEGSLLDLATAAGREGLGLPRDAEFDLIHCSGVLHHLADPSEGLAALNSVLSDDGGMFLMLYGEHGRTGIYDVQNALTDLGVPRTENPDECLRAVRSILTSLPKEHRLQATLRSFSLKHEADFDDAELYDMFCHSNDVAFDVEGIFELISEGGGGELEFAGWETPYLYDPRRYLEQKAEGAETGRMSALEFYVKDIETHSVEAYSVAEKFSGGTLAKHTFMVRKVGKEEEEQRRGEGGEADIVGVRDYKPSDDRRKFWKSTVCLKQATHTRMGDFTRDKWGVMFSEAWKTEPELMCTATFPSEWSGAVSCLFMEFALMADCTRTMEEIIEEIARQQGLGRESWLFTDREMAFKVFSKLVVQMEKVGELAALPTEE